MKLQPMKGAFAFVATAATLFLTGVVAKADTYTVKAGDTLSKIAKEKPDVAQSLSALLGAAVNGSLGYSPVTGAAEAQYGTKWNNQVVVRGVAGVLQYGAVNASNQISRFARIGSSIIKLGDSASDYEEQEYINKGSYLYRPYKIEGVDAINSTNTINIDSGFWLCIFY